MPYCDGTIAKSSPRGANAFVELTSKEKPTGDDTEQALKMHEELERASKRNTSALSESSRQAPSKRKRSSASAKSARLTRRP